MTKDEEIEQLRADNRILYGALLRQDEELEQAKQANQVLRDGVTIIKIPLANPSEKMDKEDQLLLR